MSALVPPTAAALAQAAAVLVQEVMRLMPGEQVLLTADPHTDAAALAAVAAAAEAAGGHTVSLLLARPLPFQGGLADPWLPEPLVAAAGHSDIWIDLCMPYIAGASLYERTTRNGRTRYLLGADMGAGGITRLFGGVDLDAVYAMSDALGDLFASATGQTCRLTTPAGTDVRFVLATPAGLALTRATRPGGYFVPGTAVIVPELDSVEGTIVCEAAFHEYYSVPAKAFRFDVRGRIRGVSGGGDECARMEAALRRAGQGDYGYVVHFSCGFHPAARFTGGSFIEDQRVRGADAVGFGLPPWHEGGGENHPDGVMRDHSLWIGGEQVIAGGRFVGPAAIVASAARLEPEAGRIPAEHPA
jgi:2,5-dihydroxypyridine 5,6-dioxygenase